VRFKKRGCQFIGEAIQKRITELAIQDGSHIEGGGDNPHDTLTQWIETTHDTITAASLLEKVTQLDIKERHKTVQIHLPVPLYRQDLDWKGGIKVLSCL
jgi:hypothetical protein